MLTAQREWLQISMLVAGVAAVAAGMAGLAGLFRLGYMADEAALFSPLYISVLFLIGSTLLIARYRQEMVILLGLVSIVILFVTHCAAWAADVSLGARDGMVYVTSSLALCGAIAALVLGRSPPGVRFRERHSAIVAVVGVTFAVASAYLILQRDIVRADQYASITAREAAANISSAVYDVTALLQRMGERWNAMSGAPSQAYIKREFATYLRDFPEIGKIVLIHTSDGITFSEERANYSVGWITEPPTQQELLAWLREVKGTSEARYAPFFREKHDGVWGLVAVPVHNRYLSDHFVVAQVNMTGILERALAATNSSIAEFSVFSSGHALYQSKRTPLRLDENTIVGRHAIDMQYGGEWNMSYHLTIPNLSTGVGEMGALPEIFLVSSIVFILMVSASLRFTGIAEYRARQLRMSTITDKLTGLSNRHHLEQVLRIAVQDAQQQPVQFTVVSLSLAGVRLVNETLGHAAGDSLLTEVSRRLKQQVAGSGTVARLGDDNFIVLLLDTGDERAKGYVKRLIHAMARPYNVMGQALRLTASAGYIVSSGNVQDPMRLVQHADLAMQHARHSGLNSWRRYSPEMNVLAKERLALVNALQVALDSGDLELHFQPVINGTDGRVVAVEALLRWSHEEMGSIAPLRFLPFAEETGLIIPLTDWVLAEACKKSKVIRERGFPEFPVVVNISPRYFRRDDFVQRITEVLEAASLSPAFLSVEITEGVLLENEDDAIRKLRELRSMGISTAIDDFGTGYSSLSYLKNLPVDKVKIDRTFVCDIVSDAAGAAITRGIISMAHHLGLRVVAEGVETEAQYSFLYRSQCDEFQGYLFARPEPFDVLVDGLVKNQCRVTLPGDGSGTSERVLLLVDDERNVLNALTRTFRRDGYRILAVDDVQQAFDLLAKHDVQVIIADQRMPGMSGTDFFSQVKDLYPHTTRIVLSGYTDLDTVRDAVNRGAIYRFLTKPWDDEALRREVATAFERYPVVGARAGA